MKKLSKKQAIAVAKDKKFRHHSKDAVLSASKAALRAKRVSHEPSWESKVGVAVAGVLVATSLVVWIFNKKA